MTELQHEVKRVFPFSFLSLISFFPPLCLCGDQGILLGRKKKVIFRLKSFRLRILNSNLPSDFFNQESVIQNMSNASPHHLSLTALFSRQSNWNSFMSGSVTVRHCHSTSFRTSVLSFPQFPKKTTLVFLGNLWIPYRDSWGLCILKRRQEPF